MSEETLLKEAKKLLWEDRLLHKNWKVRNEANIDLAALCDSITDPKDSRLREFGPLFRKTVADSNVTVQEKALDALIAFLKAADADAGRYAKEVCDAIVGKCLTGRPKTVEKAQAAFMLWVELEAVDVYLDAMEKAIKNKVAKAVVPAIDVMFQALSEFGSKIIPPKRILKMLPELFDHQDQNVRASSKGLTLELCRWIGKDTVKSILFEKMRDTMKATKWSERKEAVAELTKLASTRRIAPGDFTEVSRTLKKLITDVIIVVAVEAIQAIGNLARGLRTHFSVGSSFLLPVLLVNVKTSAKSKVPLVRSLTLNWVTFCIEASNKAVVLEMHKDYVDICMECINDANTDVRDAAFSVLAAIAKSVGKMRLEESLEKLNNLRRKKLSEMITGFGRAAPCCPHCRVQLPFEFLMEMYHQWRLVCSCNQI
ncbi:hypothetical protein LWI29_024353 [Acer saccharum]|uniref:TOG domain-containing protein n=1 Tax=Acer saccharum TaxID=4024 RepID=A0AA39RSC2_ACESA|nr:hypothetical protein LWI29_024353 [Acer saccharum]